MSAPREKPAVRAPSGTLAVAIFALVLAAIAFGWFTFKNGPSAHPAPAAAIEATTGRVEVLIGKGYWRQALPNESLPKGIILRTLSGAEASLRTAGGAVARLGADSRAQLVSTDLRLEQGSLTVDASGTQPGRPPLDVRTPYGTIRQAGPRFEVLCDQSGDPPLRLRVREGSAVYEGGGRSTRVEAGEELAVREDGAVRRSRLEPV